MTKAKGDTVYIATTGINYPSAKSGKEIRVEIGDIVADMPPTSLRHELEAGNVVVQGAEDDKEGSE